MRHVMRLATSRAVRPITYSPLKSYGVLQYRLYAYKTNPAFEAGAQPTVISEDGSKTLRTRNHGNKSLPLPPLMDPLAIAGKQRHKQTKAQPSKGDEGLSDFERKLRLNPHAHALATSIRQCRLTQARLPSHFLVPFTAEIATSNQTEEPATRPCLVPALRKRVQGKTYVAGTREALNMLKGKRGRWQVLLNEHMRRRAAQAMKKRLDDISHKDWSWDENVNETVLEQLRENVVDGVRACARRGLAEETNRQDGAGKHELACILTTAGAGSDTHVPAQEDVPVYELDQLLVPEQVELCMNGSSRLGLAKNKVTITTILALEKLRNYVQGVGERRPT